MGIVSVEIALMKTLFVAIKEIFVIQTVLVPKTIIAQELVQEIRRGSDVCIRIAGRI